MHCKVLDASQAQKWCLKPGHVSHLGQWLDPARSAGSRSVCPSEFVAISDVVALARRIKMQLDGLV